jgi:poly(3-hydroxybutyrate) depolymerase
MRISTQTALLCTRRALRCVFFFFQIKRVRIFADTHANKVQNQWQGDPASSGVDDLDFVSSMIAHFNDRYCIDTSRIYAAGKSNGGGFTGGYLACDPSLSQQIAAFAPVSGAFYVPGSTEDDCDPATIAIQCNPGRKLVPVLEFHGDADDTIAYAGGLRRGECLPSVLHWVEEWSKREGFGLNNKTTQLYGGKVQKVSLHVDSE